MRVQGDGEALLSPALGTGLIQSDTGMHVCPFAAEPGLLVPLL